MTTTDTTAEQQVDSLSASNMNNTATVKGSLSGTNWSTTSTTLLSHRATLLKSPTTGLRGLVISTGEPLCTLHVIIATCATTNSYSHRHDGLPHTLEHAIFLGSDAYPHKGVLDKLANRSLADGTNAWTATDHTAYTLTTAGDEGVLNLLPIYADHILYPTLTEEGFVTEIHHVNGEGEDKGVVYCEMQGRENQDGSLVDRAILDLLYPSDQCGYGSETGGILKNLRKLGNEQVQRYHRENYTPDNVMFVLTGNVDAGVPSVTEDLSSAIPTFFTRLDEVEASVKEKGVTTRPGGRPWINDLVPSMKLGVEGVMKPANNNNEESSTSIAIPKGKVVLFPSDDESRGTISMAWRGPTYAEKYEWCLLTLLWAYLTDSAASPLQKLFVECDDPLCAGLSPASEVFTEGYHQLWFHETNDERAEEIVERLFNGLRGIVDKTTNSTTSSANDDDSNGGGFDIDRMHMVIRRQRRQVLEYRERQPTNVMIDSVVRNFLYAPRQTDKSDNNNNVTTSNIDEMADLETDIDDLPFLEKALTVDTFSWISLLQDHILSRPFALVVGKPSSDLASSVTSDETEREKKQASDLGTDGLKKLESTLEDAVSFNEREIPGDVLTSVPVPSLDRVKAVPLLSVRGAGTVVSVVEKSGKGVSVEDTELVLSNLRLSPGVATSTERVTVHVDWNHIESAFLYTSIAMDTSMLTSKQRLYLPLLAELTFKLPANLDDGTHIPKDEFVSMLEDDTVSYGATLGLPGSSGLTQMMSISVQIENGDDKSGLSIALAWIRRALYLTVLSTANVRIAIKKMLSCIPPQIRDGPTICGAASAELNYNPDVSNALAATALRQSPFLESLIAKMDSEKIGPPNDGLGGGGSAEEVLDELDAIRKKLARPLNMNAFVAGDLRHIPDPVDTLTKALLPPNDGEDDNVGSTRDVIKESTRITDVTAIHVRSSMTGRAAICALSAIDSSFISLTAPGVVANDPDHAALLVAMEYLTALEGDFWVKLRGAGLTYGSSISNSTKSGLLRFGLYKCADVNAAFTAASDILVGYASGELVISAVGLEGARSSLAYSIIGGVSTRLGAAFNSWASGYESKAVDYDQWLLAGIGKLTADEVLHALVKYLIPLFDPQSNLAVSCPTGKIDEISDFFSDRGWTDVKRIPEDKLCDVFVTKVDQLNGGNAPKITDISCSMSLPGAFAAQFKCACPRCDR